MSHGFFDGHNINPVPSVRPGSSRPSGGGGGGGRYQNHQDYYSTDYYHGHEASSQKRGPERRLRIGPVIPKDMSLYPDFPNVEGVPADEAELVIKAYWKERTKRRKKEKRTLERELEQQKETQIHGPMYVRPSFKSLGPSGFGDKVPPAKKAKKEPSPIICDSVAFENCPNVVLVHGGQTWKDRVNHEDFEEIVCQITQAWTSLEDDEIDIKADGTKFYQGRGAILCLDEASRTWVKNYILTIKIEEKTYRGWDLNEDPDLTTGTILLGPMFKRLEPLEVIQKAMAKADIKGDVAVKMNVTNPGGRLIRILISTTAAKAIKLRGSKLPAGLSQLEFRFRGLETIPDKKIVEADEDKPDPEIDGEEEPNDDNLDEADNDALEGIVDDIKEGLDTEEYSNIQSPSTD